MSDEHVTIIFFVMIAKSSLFSITTPTERYIIVVFLAAVTNTNVLNWKERLQIAVDAAHGLETDQSND